MSDTMKRVRECLVRSGWEFDLPGDQDSLVDLGLDSLGLALWVVEMEKEFGVRFPPTETRLQTLTSLSKVSEVINTLLKGGRS